MMRGAAWRSLGTGLIVGCVFGLLNLSWTWMRPLADESPIILLGFYGSMFIFWTLVAFRHARRAERMRVGVAAGAAIAVGTLTTFSALNFVRVNVFLDQLVGRADWQRLVETFQRSGSTSLRAFVNLVYLRGEPVVIGLAVVIGSAVGLMAGGLVYLQRHMRNRAA